jgi:hypothetical protein
MQLLLIYLTDWIMRGPTLPPFMRLINNLLLPMELTNYSTNALSRETLLLTGSEAC